MRPDISVLKGTQVVLIADAKWKVLSSEDRKLGIASADLYQLVSYALRYQCQQLALIYPAMEGISPGLRQKLTIDGSDVQLAIYSIDLAGVLVRSDAVFDELRSWVVEG
ncbi:McrBC 5-methylcytosine restriction system component [compost metagenome]